MLDDDGDPLSVGDAGMPQSPCLGICLLDPRTRTCRGCLRTIAEIAGWHDADAGEKRAILARLAARRAAAGGVGR